MCDLVCSTLLVVLLCWQLAGVIIITASILGSNLPDDCDRTLEYHSDEFPAVDLRTVGQWAGLYDRNGDFGIDSVDVCV